MAHADPGVGHDLFSDSDAGGFWSTAPIGGHPYVGEVFQRVGGFSVQGNLKVEVIARGLAGPAHGSNLSSGLHGFAL